jgi:hypothetical protein
LAEIERLYEEYCQPDPAPRPVRAKRKTQKKRAKRKTKKG